MRALGSTAYNPALTPTSLAQAAALVRDEYPLDADELDDFAADMATIQNLTEQRLDGGNLDTLRRYTT